MTAMFIAPRSGPLVTEFTIAFDVRLKCIARMSDCSGMHSHHLSYLPLSALVMSLVACGGGESIDAPVQAQASAVGEPRAQDALGIPQADRSAAAAATARSADNACAGIRPFYWEIGNRDARLASGSITSPDSTVVYKASTVMSIASATKWVYGAFVTQRNHGVLSADDLKYLSMRSGFMNMKYCVAGQTVDGCLNYQDNGAYTAEYDNEFFYNGGHMQEHASLIGLGGLSSKALTTALKAQIGTDVKMAYSWPEIAAGIVTSADAYGRFLRKMMTGELLLGAMLGSNPVCTNPRTCAAGEATRSPAPLSETWHYSIGHWVEDDPEVGDGAFSSAGALGFYPWIDKSKQTYGIVARKGEAGTGTDSANCGRLIRMAWATGTAQ